MHSCHARRIQPVALFAAYAFRCDEARLAKHAQVARDSWPRDVREVFGDVTSGADLVPLEQFEDAATRWIRERLERVGAALSPACHAA
jgi:hypothetical protein